MSEQTETPEDVDELLANFQRACEQCQWLLDRGAEGLLQLDPGINPTKERAIFRNELRQRLAENASLREELRVAKAERDALQTEIARRNILFPESGLRSPSQKGEAHE